MQMTDTHGTALPHMYVTATPSKGILSGKIEIEMELLSLADFEARPSGNGRKDPNACVAIFTLALQATMCLIVLVLLRARIRLCTGVNETSLWYRMSLLFTRVHDAVSWFCSTDTSGCSTHVTNVLRTLRWHFSL